MPKQEKVERVILHLKPAKTAWEAHTRVCTFYGVSQTRHLEIVFRNLERSILANLTPEQIGLYFAGRLSRFEMGEAETAVYLDAPKTPISKERYVDLVATHKPGSAVAS
jgi:hypothetical protein